jgi:hypothetical protein
MNTSKKSRNAQDPQHVPTLEPLQVSAADTALKFPLESYIVAMYQGDWYCTENLRSALLQVRQ